MPEENQKQPSSDSAAEGKPEEEKPAPQTGETAGSPLPSPPPQPQEPPKQEPSKQKPPQTEEGAIPPSEASKPKPEEPPVTEPTPVKPTPQPKADQPRAEIEPTSPEQETPPTKPSEEEPASAKASASAEPARPAGGATADKTADEPEDIFASSEQTSTPLESPALEPSVTEPTPVEPTPQPKADQPRAETEPPSEPLSPKPPQSPQVSPLKEEPPAKEAEKPAAPEGGESRPDILGQKQQPEKTPQEAVLETPELEKKEILQEAHDGSAEPEEEKIKVMPEKFKKMKAKLPGKKAGKKTILLAGIIIFIAIVGGIGFYLWAQGYFQPVPIKSEPAEKIVEEPVEPIVEEPIEEPVEEPVEPVLSEEQTLTAVLKDEAKTAVITSAEFYLPEGALDPEAQLDLTGNLITEEMEKEESYQQSLYKIVGALYTFTPSDIVLNKTGTLKMFYDETLIDEKWEEDIVLGYFKNDLWTPLPSTIDTENNIVSIELEIFPSSTFALMVNKDKLAPKVEEFQIGKNIPSSVDSDNDGLTDVEEDVFSLEMNNPDSDADGNPDGQEVIGLMHPLSAAEDKLAISGLVNVYTNPTYSYSFFYPSKWLARALPDTDNQEVLIITNTGEFFSATVDNNPERLSVVDWYLKQSPQTDKSLLYETIVNNQSAVWNPTRLTIYIAKDDRVYILSYSVGIEKEANFKTTFEMIVNSFQFVIQMQGRADGTLIKYLDKPEVYLIENGKKRVFQSGEIFEKLGFTWENVIEIPLSETYLDGELITGRLNGTLIKYPDSAGIYLIDNGKKRAFKSGELFEALGFKWEDVIEIPIDETYPDGPIIESEIT
ncbi:hypothetical protein MYX07_06730, partial [Patescibacteria group bacterium AH-259-L07]|nr:hypothetical protein [Patescibacteria group bacterium AH-259-L07]